MHCPTTNFPSPGGQPNPVTPPSLLSKRSAHSHLRKSGSKSPFKNADKNGSGTLPCWIRRRCPFHFKLHFTPSLCIVQEAPCTERRCTRNLKRPVNVAEAFRFSQGPVFRLPVGV